MRPFGAWFGRLAMAGACLAGAGCGGGDVPDPDSDSRAAAPEASPRVVNRGAADAPEPAVAPKPDATAVASSAPSPDGEKSGPSPAPAKPAEKPAEPETPAPALKGDASGTDEMLRIAGTPGATPPAGDSAGGSPAAPSNPGANPNPPASGNAPGGPGGGPSGRDQQASRADASRAASNGPLTGGNKGRMAGMAENGGPGGPQPPGNPGEPGPLASPGAPGGSGGPRFAEGSGGPRGGGFGGQAGMPGGPGGASQDPTAALGPDAFNHPMTAVRAFLAALKAKDKDRLSQATARRAPTEAEEKHRKIFAEIVDQSISDDDLDEMSKALDGFQVAQVLQAKSTGRINVIVRKMSGRDMLQRTIITRKEKEGWKVMDVEAMYDFKPGLPPLMRGRGGRRR